MNVVAQFVFLVLLTLPGIVIGFTLHELAHAAVATRLGDPTPRRMGRITLNPIAHIDPLGLVLLFTIGFGMAKPVVFSPAYIRTGPQRAAVAAAGPLTNLLLAIVFALAIRAQLTVTPSVIDQVQLALGDQGINSIIFLILAQGVLINIILFVFNFLPIPGFDGFHVAQGLLGTSIPEVFRWMLANRSLVYMIGFGLLFFLPIATGFSPLIYLIDPCINIAFYGIGGAPPFASIPGIPTLFALFQSLSSP